MNIFYSVQVTRNIHKYHKNQAYSQLTMVTICFPLVKLYQIQQYITFVFIHPCPAYNLSMYVPTVRLVRTCFENIRTGLKKNFITLLAVNHLIVFCDEMCLRIKCVGFYFAFIKTLSEQIATFFDNFIRKQIYYEKKLYLICVVIEKEHTSHPTSVTSRVCSN